MGIEDTCPSKIIFLIFFSMKTYVVTPHLNCHGKTVLMMGYKICFYGEIWLIIHKLSLLSHISGALGCNVDQGFKADQDAPGFPDLSIVYYIR